jgi:hypothetical protein
MYRIEIKGELDQSWSGWLGDVQISSHLAEDGSAISMLTVNVTDQPALFGILDHIRDLNLVLIAVTSTEEVLP